jgi:hypothetical protein
MINSYASYDLAFSYDAGFLILEGQYVNFWFISLVVHLLNHIIA